MGATVLRILKIAGVAMVLAAGIGLVVITTQVVRAQSGRERPLTSLSHRSLMGSELGATVRDVDQTDMKREKLATEGGAVVDNVASNGPAAKAGFKAGDIVVSFDGEKVRSARHLTRLVQETPDGHTVEAQLMRGGEKVTVKVTPAATDLQTMIGRALEPLKSLRGLDFPSHFSMNVAPLRRDDFGGTMTFGSSARRGGRLGVSVEDLSSQLGDYFGAVTGVLVTSVDPDSPAKTAGLKAGDVLTKVDDQSIHDTAELRRLVARRSGEVTLTLVRDRKELTIKAKL
jgi:serine protease Do